jgi:hypothetical protein
VDAFKVLQTRAETFIKIYCLLSKTIYDFVKQGNTFLHIVKQRERAQDLRAGNGEI